MGPHHRVHRVLPMVSPARGREQQKKNSSQNRTATFAFRNVTSAGCEAMPIVSNQVFGFFDHNFTHNMSSEPIADFGAGQAYCLVTGKGKFQTELTAIRSTICSLARESRSSKPPRRNLCMDQSTGILARGQGRCQP